MYFALASMAWMVVVLQSIVAFSCRDHQHHQIEVGSFASMVMVGSCDYSTTVVGSTVDDDATCRRHQVVVVS